MQFVEETTKGRIKIGPGTMYGTLSKLENEQLIVQEREEDRKKIYKLSEKGLMVLALEVKRLIELVEIGQRALEG
jgi:DNA-binding PadR family transcriptional regulator